MTKILLVEDDKGIVANLTEFLTGEGYEVKSAAGQTQALALLEEEPFHLVLLDISLFGLLRRQKNVWNPGDISYGVE